MSPGPGGVPAMRLNSHRPRGRSAILAEACRAQSLRFRVDRRTEVSSLIASSMSKRRWSNSAGDISSADPDPRAPLDRSELAHVGEEALAAVVDEDAAAEAVGHALDHERPLVGRGEPAIVVDATSARTTRTRPVRQPSHRTSSNPVRWLAARKSSTAAKSCIPEVPL
jgi:hypothetical protein